MTMSKTKKSVLIMALVVLLTTMIFLCSGFTTTAYAAEAETTTETTEQVQTEETTETAPPETLFTRIESWFNDNFLEFLSTVNFGSILACIVVAIVEKKGNKKANKITLEKLGINTMRPHGINQYSFLVYLPDLHIKVTVTFWASLLVANLSA